MINLRNLVLFPLVLAFAGTAHAQLMTSLKLNKQQYLAGEPVIATVTITNHAGRDLTFYGDGRTEWLDFVVRDRHGESVSGKGRGRFGKMTIPAGKSMAREVDLSQIFLLTEPGTYSTSAVVHMPNQSGEGSSTNRVSFNQSPGSPYWTQKVGIAGSNRIREYRVLNFSGDQKTQIYIQVIDIRTGQNVRTFPLGDVLLLRKPLVTVDRQQRLHVMYLATPSMWVHSQIDTDGKLVARDIHQRGPSGDPQLLTFGDGTVRVSNSIPYDVNAAAAAKAKVRKASDRPPGTF